MIRAAFGTSFIIYAVLLGVMVKECLFLLPLRHLIWREYGEVMTWFALLLFANLFAGIYGLLRKFALTDTGEKLAHLEKQLRGRTSISDELTDRIMEEK